MSEDIQDITVEETFIDQLDFNTLYRVKGKSEIYTLIGINVKNGVCGIMEFMNHSNKSNAHKSKLICLGHQIFYTVDLSILTLRSVFKNLYDYCIDSEDWEFNMLTDEELMLVMVPNYDKIRFKKHHAIKVIKWYFEITQKISQEIDNKNNNN